jgi:hypothetical protein
MQELPNFQDVPPGYAHNYAQTVLGNSLRELLPQPKGYYRALFDVTYFTIQPGNDKPSKSQWNTLKKRMKRINRGVFILREYGEIAYDGETLCYIDFGFLQD